MAQIARRRADEFRDFVLHLKFAAIHFEQVLLAAVQHIGQRFDGARLAGSGGAQQQEHARGPAVGRKSRLMHLHVRHDLRQGLRLADHARRQLSKEITGAGIAKAGPRR